MHTVDTLFTNCRLHDEGHWSLAVDKGRFAAVAPMGEAVPKARRIVDLGGMLVLPPFVEGHIHLDTSFWGDAWIPHRPCVAGFDVRERVAYQAENMARAAPMDVRARSQLDLCIAKGSLRMRSHVMVDGTVGLGSLETILGVREHYGDRIDVQLVAFPQNGILSSPGTADLLDQAVGLGADLVGGLDPATFDGDIEAHLNVIFGIAERRGVGVDIHLHDGGTLGAFEIERICLRTRALGMQGKVAVSHAYALGDLAPDALKRSAATLAESGVAIMTNAPGSHAFPPVAPLRAAGVILFSGSDNIRDSWWPYGDGDMLGRANMIAYRSGFLEDHELAAAFDVVTSAGAAALGLEGYGIVRGGRADFVAVAAAHVPETVAGVTPKRDVYRGGRLVARDGLPAGSG